MDTGIRMRLTAWGGPDRHFRPGIVLLPTRIPRQHRIDMHSGQVVMSRASTFSFEGSGSQPTDSGISDPVQPFPPRTEFLVAKHIVKEV